MANTNNWISQGGTMLTARDKLLILLKKPSKLVLVQYHELERLKTTFKSKSFQNDYINTLYDHYIIRGLPMQHLCNNTEF